MAERYREVWVAETQLIDLSGAAYGPVYKGGLTRQVVEAYPELEWMLDADQPVVEPDSDEDLIWVLAEDWDRWRETRLAPEPEMSSPATPPM